MAKRYKIREIAEKLSKGAITSRDIVEEFLLEIDRADSEGKRAFVKVYRHRARSQADMVDRARKSGWGLPEFAGIPISIKDLFDEAGITTKAGSKILENAPPATRDADVIARLKSAGFIIIGRTNMTEFAFSGLGTNSHFGNPRCPYERDKVDTDLGRISGGSSSGCAVSVSDNMAVATIGSDTGGSTRIPATFCGIVGFKPSTFRMSSRGIFPLSPSFDAAGPMGNTVSCCSILDALMAGENTNNDYKIDGSGGLRFAIPTGYLLEDLDREVSKDFAVAVDKLSSAGNHIIDVHIDEIESLRPSNNSKSIVAAEAYQIHKKRLESNFNNNYDPFVSFRLGSGKDILASEFLEMVQIRKTVCKSFDSLMNNYDALILPTVPIIPPRLSDLTNIRTKSDKNSSCLRNTAVSNFLDLPTITVPCHSEGQAPTGFSVIGLRGQDKRLFAIASICETIVKPNELV